MLGIGVPYVILIIKVRFFETQCILEISVIVDSNYFYSKLIHQFKLLLLQETKSTLENSEMLLMGTRNEIQSIWQQLRQMYFELQVT